MVRVTIVTCTYFSKEHMGEQRALVCLRSLESWKCLSAELHISDDGSDPEIWDWFEQKARGIYPALSFSRQPRKGLGASLNAGFAHAWGSGLAFYIQDDLSLEQPIDLSFPAAILEQYEDIMAVRIGFPHPDTTGKMRHFAGLHRRDSMVLELDPHHYVMSTRPFLAHRRMMRYGPYLECESAETTEREFNERYVRDPKLKVVQWIPSPWYHQHVVNLGIIQPKGEA